MCAVTHQRPPAEYDVRRAVSVDLPGGVVPSLGVEGALRRVASFAARGADPEPLFAAIGEEAVTQLGVTSLSLLMVDSRTRTLTEIATYGAAADPRGQLRTPLDQDALARVVIDTGAAVRIDGSNPLWRRRTPVDQEPVSDHVGAPIIVDDVTWGVIKGTGEAGVPLPSGCARRLADFAELMSIGIANERRRDELRDLIETQSALRRVATLVAEDAEPHAVFAAVAVEASRVLRVGAVSLIRFDAGAEQFTKIFGTHGDRAAVPDGVSWSVADCPEGELVLRTRAPGRIDDWSALPGEVAARHRDQGFGQAVAAPIVLDGAFWGHIAAFGEAGAVLPPGCETELADFTQLMGSALANAQAHAELRALAAEQGAALRRVATLVAQRAAPSAIFGAVAVEASRALHVSRVDVGRYHQDGSVSLLGSTAPAASNGEVGFPEAVLRVSAVVLESGQAARLHDQGRPDGPGDPFETVVAAPIVVDGRFWGVVVVLSDKKLGDDTETRLTDFTHLVASSIAIVQTRNDLIASRARIVSASDEARRRIERNLHDGIQQRVVSLGLTLRAVRARFPLSPEVSSGLDDVAADLDSLLEEVRIFSQGLHPALLSRSGLGPSLRALARRSALPVRLEVPRTRYPEPVETAMYYVVSEAIANATKHAQASEVVITVDADGAAARADIADDGIGGAEPGHGSGLTGLVDRVEALGGSLLLDSPVGAGTRLRISLPLTAPGRS